MSTSADFSMRPGLALAGMPGPFSDHLIIT